MTRRNDSDIDLEKYKPSIEESLQLADHDAAEERLRKAFDDPELRALLAAEGRSVEFTPVPPAPPTEAPAVLVAQEHPRPAWAIEAPTDTSAPAPSVSPWAKDAPPATAVDAAALPSADAPGSATAGRAGKSGQGTTTGAPPAQVWTPTRKALGAIALAFLPAMLVFILFVKPDGTGARPVTDASVRTSAASTAPGASVTTSATGVPSTMPSAEPTSQPSGTPVSSAKAPEVAPLKPRPRSTAQDPYDAGSAVPAVTQVPSSAPPPRATSPAETPASPPGPPIFRPRDE